MTIRIKLSRFGKRFLGVHWFIILVYRDWSPEFRRFNQRFSMGTRRIEWIKTDQQFYAKHFTGW